MPSPVAFASWRSTSLPASSVTAATIVSPAKPTAETSARTTTGADSKLVWLIETLADADVPGDPSRRGHDGIDRRQLRPVEVAGVGPVAVGEEEDAGQRQAAEPPREGRERGRQRRARAVEGQGVEAVDGAEVRVEGVAADVEILPQPGLPGGFLAEPVAEPVAAGRRAPGRRG